MMNKRTVAAALATCLAVSALSGCGGKEEVTEAQTTIAVSMENVDVLKRELGTTTTTTVPVEESETTSVSETTVPETTKAMTTTTVKVPVFSGVKVTYDSTGVDEEALAALEAAKKGAEAIANNDVDEMLKWIYFPVYLELCSGGTAYSFDEEVIKEWIDLDIEEGRNPEEAWAANYAMYQDLKFYNPVRLTDDEITDLKHIFTYPELVGAPKTVDVYGYMDYEPVPEDKQRIYKVNVAGEFINQIYTSDETPYMYVVGHNEYNWDTGKNEMKFKLDALMMYLEQGANVIDQLPLFEGRYKDGEWNEDGDKDNLTDNIFIPFKDVFYKRQRTFEERVEEDRREFQGETEQQIEDEDTTDHEE